MAKRPRFAANLQVSGKSRLPADGLAQAAVAVDEAEIPVDAEIQRPTTLPAPVPREIDIVGLRPEAVELPSRESLPSIFGDAFTAMSLASCTGLTQAFVVQFRLASYVLGLQLPRQFALTQLTDRGLITVAFRQPGIQRSSEAGDEAADDDRRGDRGNQQEP